MGQFTRGYCTIKCWMYQFLMWSIHVNSIIHPIHQAWLGVILHHPSHVGVERIRQLRWEPINIWENFPWILGAKPFCLSSISSCYCFFSENLSSFIYPHRTHTSDKMLIQVLFIDLIFSWTNPMSIFRHPPVQVGMQVLQYPCAPQSATGLHTFSNLSMEWFGRRVKEPQLFILFFLIL